MCRHYIKRIHNGDVVSVSVIPLHFISESAKRIYNFGLNVAVNEHEGK